MDQWNIDKHMSVDDPDYRRVIFKQITACHPGLPDNAYQRIYEASIFRDEGMAKIIKEYLKKKARGGRSFDQLYWGWTYTVSTSNPQ